jgi:uncharacterized protein (DUF488 family)
VTLSTIWTIGHSTRTSDELVAVLRAHHIEAIVDVRRFPASRRLPQFGADQLEAFLGASDIGYRWVAELGGRRRPNPASPNDSWRHPAFRAYADHVATDDFANGLFELLMIAAGVRTAVMCAEVLWWRCHRRIIADVLTSLGHQVRHVRDAGESELHKLAPQARIAGGVLTYTSATSD